MIDHAQALNATSQTAASGLKTCWARWWKFLRSAWIRLELPTSVAWRTLRGSSSQTWEPTFEL